jgi:hypothetical protein
VEAVLTASFRPDRQGPLLLGELLPVELPVEGGESARDAWERLVDAQARGQESGVPDPWGFAALVRKLHAALTDDSLCPAKRRHVLFYLSYGPTFLPGEGGVRDTYIKWAWGFDEVQLREEWDSWASAAQEWTELDWCYWRFVRKFGRERAFAAHAKAEAAEDERQKVETMAKYKIRDVRDPYLMLTPMEDRARLVRLAGLEPIGV